MPTIMIARHGETDWNRQDIFRGHADIELNSNGVRQAELLGEYLKDKKFDAIYASPLERALRTAKIVAKHHSRTPFEASMDLIDIDFGEFQGVAVAEIKEKKPEFFKRWTTEPHRIRFPGGEDFSDVKKRATKFLETTVLKHEGTVLLVTHRVVAVILILQMLGMELSHFQNIQLDPCGLTTFKAIDNRFILVCHNDTSFLRQIH